ncbi:condensation domain-containing protein [Haloactinospora alba]|uniref:Condensation domain-containing protein n=1 Tax=Haloactinospora alba TaxID=405555 RepID=A0A543N719_9ACTN|nr:condensation domain-containing protein [Haloactinospora alba]TQN27625.1 condensation domain-containing protein [Haloactinospora alba]
MNVHELVLHLREEDIQLSNRDGSLAFDAPEGALTDTVLAELRRHKPRLLAELPPGAPPLAASGPAAWMQRYLADRHSRTNTPETWNVAYRLDISGPLDTSRLDRALRALADRHQGLRTRFREYAGRLVQEVLPEFPPRPDTVDLRPGADRSRAPEEEVARWCGDAARAPFDPARGPLFRAPLARVGPREWVLVLVQHHMVTDAVSVGVLLRELEALYTAEPGDAGPLPPLTTRLVDHARWQNQLLEGPHGRRLEHYWREELAGAALDTPLPGDRPRPDQLSGAGAVCPMPLDRALTDRLEECARSSGVTVYTVLLTVFARLLTLLTGRDEAVVIGNFANRERREFEPLVGMLMTALPLRVRFDPASTVQDAVRATGRTVLGAVEHQALPLPLLREWLRLHEYPGGERFPQTWFVLNPPEPRSLDLGGPDATVTEVTTSGARSDLGATASPEDGLRFFWELSTDFLTTGTVREWTRRYRSLLADLLDTPSLTVAEWR